MREKNLGTPLERISVREYFSAIIMTASCEVTPPMVGTHEGF